MKNYSFYAFLGLILLFSCEQKPSTENTATEIDSSESQKSGLTTNLNDSLFFNFSDTLSKYNKPILFYMSTDWCRGCKSVEKGTINNVEFRSMVDNEFKFYKIDGDLPYKFYLKDSVYIKQELMNDFMYAFYKPSRMASYPSYMIINENEKVETVIPPQFKAKHSEMVELFVSLSE